jgi:hypothetical protein
MPTDMLHFTRVWTPTDLFKQDVGRVAPELKKLATLGMSQLELKDQKKIICQKAVVCLDGMK